MDIGRRQLVSPKRILKDTISTDRRQVAPKETKNRQVEAKYKNSFLPLLRIPAEG